MKYTNLQMGIILAVMFMAVVIGTCIPAIVNGDGIVRAQEPTPYDNRVVVEYIGDQVGGFKVNVWRIADYAYSNVCYLSDTIVCIPMR